MHLILLSGNIQSSIVVSFVHHLAESNQIPIFRNGGVVNLSIGVIHLQKLQFQTSRIAAGGSVFVFLIVPRNFQFVAISLFFFLNQVFRGPPNFVFVLKRVFSFCAGEILFKAKL